MPQDETAAYKKNLPKQARKERQAFIKLLKEARIDACMSMSEAAECAGIKKSTLSHWELGISLPPRDVLHRLIDCYREHFIESMMHNVWLRSFSEEDIDDRIFRDLLIDYNAIEEITGKHRSDYPIEDDVAVNALNENNCDETPTLAEEDTVIQFRKSCEREENDDAQLFSSDKLSMLRYIEEKHDSEGIRTYVDLIEREESTAVRIISD